MDGSRIAGDFVVSRSKQAVCRKLRLALLLLVMQLPGWAQSRAGVTDAQVQKLYAEAKAAEANRDVSLAITKYEAILSIAPLLGAAYNNLGLLYFQQREYQQAAAVLKKGLKIDPSMPSASALLGMSLYEMGQYQDARPPLEQALRSSPKDDHAALFLANTLIKLEEYEGAARRLQDLARQQPDNQEAWYLLGKVYMQLSQQALSKMNSIDPNSALVHEVSGEIMEGMKNFDGALTEYKKAVEMAPHRAGIHYKLGNAYWILSQWDAAQEQFQAELANDPNNCVAFWKIGNIALEQNHPPEDALASIDKALLLCPRLTQARVDRAHARIKLGHNEDALADLQIAVKASPEEPSIHFLLAQTYRALGRTEESQAELQAFTKLDESARAVTAEHARQVIQNKDSAH